MTEYDARLQIEGDASPPMPVTVDLTGEHLKMRIGDEEIADWAKDQMRISAMPDGFHISAEGEAVVLDVSEDAAFAVEIGLRSAPPHLRQRMAALMRERGITD
jgi:hypothetical protein